VTPDDTVYTANRTDGTVSVILAGSTTVSRTVRIGEAAEPRGVGIDDNGVVYVVGHATDTLYRINRGSASVSATTGLGRDSDPYGLALTRGGDIYAADSGSDSVTRVRGVSAPAVMTLKARKGNKKSVRRRNARLTADVFAGGLPTTVQFLYGPKKDLTRKVKRSSTSVVSAGHGRETVALPTESLKRGQRYYYRAVASNDVVTTVGKIKKYRVK
jgi:YVTN family beta-propeller protein